MMPSFDNIKNFRRFVPQISSAQVGQAARYAALPGILPRIRELGIGFPSVALWMAQLYAACGLLARDHAFVRNDATGEFGVLSVFVEASRNLRFRWKHIDQLLIFFGLMAAFVLLGLQCFLLVLMLTTPAAQAIGFTDMFSTQNPRTDMAFQLLDRVFAVPGFFGSSEDPAVLGGISPFNVGLHSLFGFYNTAMMGVGGLILVYFLFVVAVETATTGTPFGQRFASVYAPIRLALAVLLLVPIGFDWDRVRDPDSGPAPRSELFAGGLNTAQYLVLYLAKTGSSLATNSWISFNRVVAGGGATAGTIDPARMIGTNAGNMVAMPQAADVSNTLRFLQLALICKHAYEARYPAGAQEIKIEPYLVRMFGGQGADNETRRAFLSTPYEDAVNFSGTDHITIRFGHYKAPAEGETESARYGLQMGNVFPFCGEVTVRLHSRHNPGAVHLQKAQYNEIKIFWENVQANEIARNIASDSVPAQNIAETVKQQFGANYIATFIAPVQARFQQNVFDARKKMIDLGAFAMHEDHLKKGWGAAGLFTNTYASQTGPFLAAAGSVPEMKRLPEVMNRVQAYKRSSNSRFIGSDRFLPRTAADAPVPDNALNTSNHTVPAEEREIALALGQTYDFLSSSTGQASLGQPSSNVFRETVGLIFGTGALFSMRENPDIHPVAKLAALGKGIIEHTVVALMGALGLSFGGGLVEIFNQQMGVGIESIGSLLMTVAMIGLVAGFVLFYIIPFLPFMYFLFAMMKWVQTIFEAMVGLPLWALAHLRIEGNGLPGQAASNGYFLLLEIFLRPIMIVFGLVASFIIFATMVQILDILFEIVTQDIDFDGADAVADGEEEEKALGLDNLVDYAAGELDAFFVMIIYTIVVYLAGVSCFKLVDQIPNGVMRWIGSSAKNAVNNVQDSAQFLDYTFMVPAMQTIQGAAGATKQFAEGLPRSLRSMMPETPPQGGGGGTP